MGVLLAVGMRPGEPACFNANCHPTVTQNAHADQLLPHVKLCFARGGVGLVSCPPCLEALLEGLSAKSVTHPPNTVCQICAGVNITEGKTIQLFANGEFSLWICNLCQKIQQSVIQSNFYLAQTLVPTKTPEDLFTFNLPKEPPKKRYVPPPSVRGLDVSNMPAIKRMRPATSRRTQPWEETIIAAVNQQEKILGALEQLDLLQKQQARNLRTVQTAVPSLAGLGDVRKSNEKLSNQLEKTNSHLKQAETQKEKFRTLLEDMQSKIGSPAELEVLLGQMRELTEPLPAIEESADDDDTMEDDIPISATSEPSSPAISASAE